MCVIVIADVLVFPAMHDTLTKLLKSEKYLRDLRQLYIFVQDAHAMVTNSVDLESAKTRLPKLLAPLGALVGLDF